MATATYEAIATQTLGSNQATITFNSLGAYTDIFCVFSVRTTRSDYDDAISMRFNSDSGSNYSSTYISSFVSNPASYRESNSTGALIRCASASATSGVFTPVTISLMNYSNTSVYKTCLTRWNEAPSGGSDYGAGACVSLWRNTAAITSITLTSVTSSNFLTGSTFTIYGIKAA